MWGTVGEDEYWEHRREEYEAGWSKCEEPQEETGTLFLDDEIEEIERQKSCTMDKLYEGDLLDILQEMEGIEANSAVWNRNYGCIEYRYIA